MDAVWIAQSIDGSDPRSQMQCTCAVQRAILLQLMHEASQGRWSPSWRWSQKALQGFLWVNYYCNLCYRWCQTRIFGEEYGGCGRVSGILGRLNQFCGTAN